MIPVDRDKDFLPAIEQLEEKIDSKTGDILDFIDGLSKKLEEILKRMDEPKPPSIPQTIKPVKTK